jgi:hypothetical protein
MQMAQKTRGDFDQPQPAERFDDAYAHIYGR